MAKKYLRMLSIVIACSFLVSHAPLHRWEADVHYVLTFWLATQAGFDRGDADQIASGDQSYDNSPHHAAIPNMIWLQTYGDTGGARDLQRKHFPSDALLPSPPLRRVVGPNSLAARAAAETCIRNQIGNALALVEFGEALHPFQDSWSHQGVPDVPLRPGPELRPDLSCAHPEKRGGWNSHDADLTHLPGHDDEVVKMAEETYKFFQRFLAVNNRRAVHPPVEWSKIEPIVREFAQAKTRSEKNTWAQKYISSAQPTLSRFSARLTLPGASAATVSRVRLLQPHWASEAPASLIQQARSFIVQWLLRQDTTSAAESIHLASLRDQFVGGKSGLTESRDALARWCRKFITMYLVADHSAVNSAGHGDPSHPGYERLPETVQREGAFATFAAVEPDFPVAADFGQVKDATAPTYSLVLQFGGQPYDAIVLVWQQRDGRWMIIRMYAVIG